MNIGNTHIQKYYFSTILIKRLILRTQYFCNLIIQNVSKIISLFFVSRFVRQRVPPRKITGTTIQIKPWYHAYYKTQNKIYLILLDNIYFYICFRERTSIKNCNPSHWYWDQVTHPDKIYIIYLWLYGHLNFRER